MSGECLYYLIQAQVFMLSDNIICGNGIFQVNSIASCVLTKGVDIGGNIRIVNRADFDGLEVLHLIVQRQYVFAVTMHQFQQQELKRNIFVNGPNIHTGTKA